MHGRYSICLWLLAGLLLTMADMAPASAQAQARAEKPTNVQRLLRELQKASDPARAARLREKLQRAWIDAGPMSAQVLLKQAARAQAAGLVDTAEQLLRLAAARWPDYAEARYRLAFLLWQRGHTSAALRQLDTLLARQPAHFPAAALRLRLLLEQERRKEALAACEALLRNYPHWVEMRRRCQRLRWRLEQDA